MDNPEDRVHNNTLSRPPDDSVRRLFKGGMPSRAYAAVTFQEASSPCTDSEWTSIAASIQGKVTNMPEAEEDASVNSKTIGPSVHSFTHLACNPQASEADWRDAAHESRLALQGL